MNMKSCRAREWLFTEHHNPDEHAASVNKYRDELAEISKTTTNMAGALRTKRLARECVHDSIIGGNGGGGKGQKG